MKKKKVKVNPWKDWDDYEEKNLIKKVLEDITTYGFDRAMEINKIEDWFKPKILEHMERVKNGETVQDI